MDIFLTLFIYGLSEGAITFLIAVGLSIIWGMMDVVNFSHGAIFVWGAYMSAWVFAQTGSFLAGLLAAVAVTAAIGLAMEKLLISRIYKRHSAQIVLTLGLSIILVECVTLAFGVKQVAVAQPVWLSGRWDINGVVIPHYRLFLIAVGAAAIISVYVVFYRTRLGMVIRAGVQRPDMVEALGINIRRYFTLVFTAGAALAGLGGALYAPMAGALIPQAGEANQISAIIVLIIGGLGDVMGTASGSVFLGLLDKVVAWFLPSMSIFANAIVMALVLTFRPRGLFRGLSISRLWKRRDIL
jgi:branched-chain amino acid transport system permease protein